MPFPKAMPKQIYTNHQKHPSVRLALALAIALLVAFPPAVAQLHTQQEHKSIVLVILDGVGAYYVMDGLTPHSLSGRPLKKAEAPSYLGEMHAYAVPTMVPKTAQSHAVLFTGCSLAEPEAVGFENASIFDVARSEGYHVYAIMQQGDTSEVIAEQDAILYFADGLEAEDVRVVYSARGHDVGELMEAHALAYDGDTERWVVECALDVMQHSKSPFLLTVNIATCDHVAHVGNLTAYVGAIEYTLRALEPLVSECARRGCVLAITSDHGMAFWSERARGGHASSDYANSPEATTCILYLSEMPQKSIRAQQDIAPALLRLAGIHQMPRYADVVSPRGTPDESREPKSIPTWRVLVGAVIVGAINTIGIVLLRRLL